MIEKNSSQKVKGLIVTSTFFIFCAFSFQNVWAGVSPVAGGGKTSVKEKPVLVAAPPRVPPTVAFDGIPRAVILEKPMRIVVKAKIKNFNPREHDITVYLYDKEGKILAGKKRLRPNPSTHLLISTFIMSRKIKNAASVQIIIGDKNRDIALAIIEIPIR